MPRIPTYDRSENVAGRPQPFSTGDGYAAPGRAMQQLGEGLQRLGTGLDAALKVEQGKKDEEDRFKMNMEWLKFTSQQDLYQTDYDKKITGDGSSHVPGRMEGYDTAFGEFFGRVAPQSPRLRRELQLRGMQYRGQVQQRTSRTAEGHRDFYFSSVAEKGITGTVLPRVTYDITTARQGLDLAEGIIASAPITEQRKAQLRDRAAAAILDAWKDRAFKAYEAEGIGDPAKMVEEQLKKYGDSFKPSPTQPQKPGAPDALPPPSGEKPTTGSYTMPPSARDDRRIPASLRYNNPGAQWPGPSSRKFGAVGFVTLRDGQGNKIAVFDTFEQGAAAQFDLLYRKYAGKPLTRLLTIWSGGNHPAAYTRSVAGEMGIKPDTIITREMLRDPKIAIPLARAMARVESGREHPAPVRAWQTAHRMALGGPQASQPASAIPAPSMPEDQPAVPYGPEAEFEPQKPPAEGMPGAPIQVAEAPPPWVSGAPRTTMDYFARRLWLDNDKIRRQTRIVGEAFRKRREALELVAGVLAGTREFNPHDDASRKTIDKVFSETEVSKKLFAGDPTTIMRAVELGHRLNYLPKPVGEAVRGLVDHADPVKRQLGLTAAAAILARRPRAFSEVQGSAGMVKEALLFQSLRETRGMSAEDAVKHLDLMKSPEWKKLAEVRGKEAKLKADAYGESHITKIFDPSMLPNFLSPEQAKRPDLSPVTAGVMFGGNQVLIKRARELFQEHYIKTGDETVAWAATGKELKAMYGSSSVTGKRLLMRYPPEAIYPQIAQKPELMDYVNKDIQASVKKVLGKDVPIGSIYLFADAETQRSITAGQGPRYGLAYLDKESGLYKIVPGRFYIDPKGLEAVSKKQFDDARKKALEKETRAPHMLLRGALDSAKRAVTGGQPPAKPPSPATPSRGTPEPTSTRLPGKPVRPDRSDTYTTDVPGQDEPSGPVIRPGSPLDRLWRYINPQ